MPTPTPCLFVVLLCCSCMTGHAQGSRFLRCLTAPSCPSLNEQPSTWSAEHEALYWRAVEALVKKEACGGELAGKVAYQAEKRLSIVCDVTKAKIPWIDPKVPVGNAFSMDGITHADVFAKERALRTCHGAGVELSVNYYAKCRGAQREALDEGADGFVVVESNGVLEIRLISQIAI